MSPRTWPSWLGAGLLTLMWLLPAAVRNGFALGLAHVYCRRQSPKQRIVDINLQLCFPDLDAGARQALYLRYQTALLRVVFLSPRLWWGSAASLDRHCSFHGQHYLDQALADNQAVVLSVSHTLALDVGMIAMSPNYPLQGFYKPFENPVLDWLVRRSRTRFGGVPMARGEGFRAIIQGLKRGAILCYLTDEDLGRKGSVFAPFFGHQKATFAMLPRIVKHTSAVVIPMATYYDAKQDRFHTRFFEPLANYPTDDKIDNATRLNASIEATVRHQPDQYLWKLRLFRTCPAGGHSRYRQIERGELTLDDV